MLGRYGELGTVVDTELAPGDTDGPALIVRGGVSEALLYHVPGRRILDVSNERRTVTADAHVADFVPILGGDGTVVLRMRS